MQLSGIWSLLLLWIYLFQGGHSNIIGDTCGNQLTIAGLNDCRVDRAAFIAVILALNPPPTISDVCAARTSFCFHDDVNDEYACTFNAVSYNVDCACPMEGIRWTEGRADTTFRPGKTCNDLDECADGNDDCDPTRADCSNIRGSFECTCKYGYVGDGKICTPDPAIDPCLNGFAPICDINAACAPRARSPQKTNTLCVCRNLSVNGEFGCFSSAGLGSPHLTIANNGMTAFKCYERCTNLGFIYAAATPGDCYCTDTEPSNMGTCTFPCGPSSSELCGTDGDTAVASFYYTGADHSCTCNSGYEGTGEICTDANECITETAPAHSTCNNLPGSFEFLCNDNFIKDASGACVAENVLDCNSIEAIDTIQFRRQETWAPDCSRVIFEDCGGGNPEEVLTGSSDGTSACTGGSLVSQFDHEATFDLNNFQTNTSFQYLNPIATCGESKFSLLLDRAVLNAAGFSLDEMGFGDFPAGGDTSLYPNECRGRRYADEAGLRYLFEHDFSDTCGVTRMVNSDTEEVIYFTLTGITGGTPNVVSRQARLRFYMTCTYTKTKVVNSRFFSIYNPRRKREAVMPNLQVKSSETFLFDFQPSSPVKAGEMAFLEVDITSGNALQWMRCWQSDSSDSKQGKKRSIFDRGCNAADDLKLDNSVTIYRNKANSIRFGFYPSAFSGGESENIYVHCIVNKCDTSKSDSCHTCNSDEFLPTSTIVSSSAIVFSDVCGGEANGGCEQECSVDENGEALCGCVSGFGVDPQNPTLCKGVPGGIAARSGNSNFEWYYVVIPVVAILLIAAAILVARKTKEPSKSYKMPDLADLADDA